MTFTALSQGLGWLLVAVAAIVAAALFIIRPRPQHATLATLALWQRVLDGHRRRSLWDRIRWAVSLMATAAIAVAIALAIAKPVRGTAGSGGGRTLIVIDSSWSMRARTPDGVTRWDRAIERARAIAGAAGGEIALATTAGGTVEGPSADRAVVDSVLDRLTPTGAPDGAWPGLAGVTAVHLITDGAVARSIPPDVTVHSVFAPVPNVAIAAFDVVPAPAAGDGAEVFVAVANYAAVAQPVDLTITRGADVVLARSIRIAAGDTVRERVAVPTIGGARFHARVSAPGNDLAIDDEAAGWLWTAQPLRVGVVGAASDVPALLARDPSVRVSIVEPSGYRDTLADVWVFDRWLPADAPARPALVIDPPASAWLGPLGAAEAAPTWRTQTPHPVLDGVDAALVHIRAARGVIRPALQPIAASNRNTPLVGVEDSAAGRYVVLGFSTAGSNVTSTTVFPILIANAMDWLGRPERGRRHLPGPILLPASTRRLVGPGGQFLPLSRRADRVTATLPGPGLFAIDAGGVESVIDVGFDDPRRSNLQTSSVPPDRSPPFEPTHARRPWWIVAALTAFVLAAIEWITWRRRLTV